MLARQPVNHRACRRVCPKYNGAGTWAFPRSILMSDELNQLRREVARLRRDLDHVLRVIGQEEKLPQQPRPPFLLLDAEVISIRHSSDKMPILLKAEEGYACIYLNDNEGRARGLFQVDNEGSARFEIWNKDQEVVVSIGETKDGAGEIFRLDRKSTRLNSSHLVISYAVFCLKKKNTTTETSSRP